MFYINKKYSSETKELHTDNTVNKKEIQTITDFVCLQIKTYILVDIFGMFLGSIKNENYKQIFNPLKILCITKLTPYLINLFEHVDVSRYSKINNYLLYKCP